MSQSDAPMSLVTGHVIDELIESARLTPSGAFIEVGVYKGGTAWHLAALARSQGRPLYLYDTFTGIPYADPAVDSHVVGDFRDTSAAAVQEAIPDAIIIEGIFPQSAIEMPPIAFAHLDCDQYQSIREASEYLIPRMVSGGVIWFDDYNCLSGATRAVHDVFGDRVQIAPVSKKAFVVL